MKKFVVKPKLPQSSAVVRIKEKVKFILSMTPPAKNCEMASAILQEVITKKIEDTAIVILVTLSSAVVSTGCES